MGTSLNGLTPAGTYPGLIKTGDNAPIDGTLKTLSDGNGNNLPMAVSTTAVNFTNQLQQGGVAVPTASQVNAKQDTLVSGTNIKTINGTSVLGSGDIVTPQPSGVSGAIQFSNGSAFASDATNLFWDDTNNRLGVGTNAPTTALDVNGSIRAGVNLTVVGEIQNPTVGVVNINGELRVASPNVSIGLTSYPARLAVRGSGTTSGTTSLLVQNSAGLSTFFATDDRNCGFGGTMQGPILRASTVVACSAYNTQAFNALYMVVDDTTNLGNVNFGTVTAVASARVQIDSTTRGFLPPRMTTTQKNAIATPAAGLVVYDSTTNKLCCYNGSTWNDLF